MAIKQSRPIDKVTVQNLDVALRMIGVNLNNNLIDKIIDLIELIEEKGDYTTMKDVFELQSKWTPDN